MKILERDKLGMPLIPYNFPRYQGNINNNWRATTYINLRINQNDSKHEKNQNRKP